MVFDDVTVRLLLALGALAALFGAFLQAILELFEYRDLVNSAELTHEATQELLTQYRNVSYCVSFFL
jgi:ribosomal protein S12 methylthiotransferase accessory factor YcaO